ncbi:MAG: bifunctional serine/threonine-protein kinase/formylglycine-generating enzyme family protein [Gemmataceae bacterium]
MTPCPPDDRLRAFDRGGVPEAELDAIAAHLGVCLGCVDRLARLAVAVGPLADASDPEPDHSAYRRAVARAAGLNPARPRLPAPGDALRDYRLVEVVGRGGMGTVFRAVHARLDKVVAVKVLTGRRWGDPDAAARFAREMKAVGRLAHPHVVQATDAGDADGVPFLVMEYVEGLTLSALVRRDGPRPVAEACDLVRQAAAGLGYAHASGLVHRDVKPSNLIRTAGGVVKVLDLGLALPLADPTADAAAGLSSESGGSDLTSASRVVGTVGYMAPEQRRNAHAVDARADVYGLGATLWFLLTGEPPGGGFAAPGALPGSLPPALWRKLLAPDPAERFADMAALSAALAPFCVPPRSRSKVPLAVGALACVAGALVVALRPPAPAPAPAAPTPVAAAPAPVGIAVAAPRVAPPPGALPMAPLAAGALQLDWAEFLGAPPFRTHPAGLDFALVPPGELDLAPNARVVVTRPYRIGTTVVTRGQFAAFVAATGHVTDVEQRRNGEYVVFVADPGGRSGGTRSIRNPAYSWRAPGYADPADADPATQVSWDDAAAFCRWLSAADGRPYRLPTEAEWTWAVRAGDAGDELPDRAPFAPGYPQPQLAARPMRPTATSAGRMNPWGVCTGGRVEEWCRDWFGVVPAGRTFDFENATPHVAGIRLTCGDSYAGLRTHYGSRAAFLPQAGRSSIGFRVVCEAP